LAGILESLAFPAKLWGNLLGVHLASGHLVPVLADSHHVEPVPLHVLMPRTSIGCQKSRQWRISCSRNSPPHHGGRPAKPAVRRRKLSAAR
jgi:hypothetical protein